MFRSSRIPKSFKNSLSDALDLASRQTDTARRPVFNVLKPVDQSPTSTVKTNDSVSKIVHESKSDMLGTQPSKKTASGPLTPSITELSKRLPTSPLSSSFQKMAVMAAHNLTLHVLRRSYSIDSVRDLQILEQARQARLALREQELIRYNTFMDGHRGPFIQKMNTGQLTLGDLRSPFQETFDKEKLDYHRPIATEKGVDVEDHLREVRANTKRIFDGKIDACIRFWGDTLEDMFKNNTDPEIQTLFDTGISSALASKFLRETTEEAHFGYPVTSWKDSQPPTKNEYRQAYGYAASKGKGGRVEAPKVAESLKGYGTVVFVLNEDVHEATTAIVGDSLTTHNDLGTDPPRVTAIPAPLKDLNENIYQINDIKDKKIDPTKFQDFEDIAKQTGRFVELQFHRAVCGSLKVSKVVEKVYFLDPANITNPNPRDGCSRRDPKQTYENLKKQLDEMGIPYETLES